MTGNGLFLYDSDAPKSVLVFTSKKRGSCGAFSSDSFDLGIFAGGGSESARKNLSELKNLNGIVSLALLKQAHGSKIVDALDAAGSDFPEGDGLITGVKGLALGIFTADCYSAVLFGKSHIAALHCGRKSLYEGIIERAVKEFEKRGDFPLEAYVGPGICGECYEVCRDALPPFSCPADGAVEIRKNGRYGLNLRKIIENALKIHKITNCRFSGVCTSCSPEFYSYRRDGAETGRMLTIAMLREKYD